MFRLFNLVCDKKCYVENKYVPYVVILSSLNGGRRRGKRLHFVALDQTLIGSGPKILKQCLADFLMKHRVIL